jgi:hypothetical protein
VSKVGKDFRFVTTYFQTLFNILSVGGKIGSFAKLGLWVGLCGFTNVPMCGLLKLFFKMCGGKNF